jgi:capsule polysaccharide export protein KpsC/LpsZ
MAKTCEIGRRITISWPAPSGRAIVRKREGLMDKTEEMFVEWGLTQYGPTTLKAHPFATDIKLAFLAAHSAQQKYSRNLLCAVNRDNVFS